MIMPGHTICAVSTMRVVRQWTKIDAPFCFSTDLRHLASQSSLALREYHVLGILQAIGDAMGR